MQLLNPLTWFVSLREKILALIALFLIGLAAGWSVHTIVDEAFDDHRAKTQLKIALVAPAKISKFQQALKKTHVEQTPCYSTSIPVDVLKLLH